MRTGRPLRVGGSSHVLIACAAAILLGVSHATSALAQATQATGKCIANLVAIAPKNPLGYSARSTPARCEGIHQTQFAGRIYLSAVGAGAQAGLATGDQLNVRWLSVSSQQLPPDALVQLVVVGRKDDEMYRLDAYVKAQDGGLSWPAEILDARKFTLPQLDVLAKARSPAGVSGVDSELIIPSILSRGSSAGSQSSAQMFATIWSDAALERVSVSYSFVQKTGEVGPTQDTGQYCRGPDSKAQAVKLGCTAGPWPARSRILVQMPDPAPPANAGFLTVKIVATTDGRVVGVESFLVPSRAR